MGYFSTLACDFVEFCPDHSITEPQQQLLWRVEELQERLTALKRRGAAYSKDVCYCDSELRYMPPVCFNTLFETERAIEMAVFTLKYTYGIDLHPEMPEEPIVDEITENQLTFMVLLPGILLPAAA